MEENNVAFARHRLPAMEVGEYTMTVEQTASGIDGFEKDRAAARLVIGGERFRPGPEKIYSAYPAPNALGEFKNTFPHIVFLDSTFPWQRRFGRAPGAPLPWLWLLLSDETEPVATRETTVGEALAETPGVFVPALSPAEHESPDSPCTVVEAETAFFKAILPPVADLPFTAHVRIVNLDDKVTDPAVTGEAFSCLLANRFTREPPPAEGGDGVPALRHTAHVVSLEGYEPFLHGEAEISEPRVRLFCLHRWSFSVARSPFDFKTVMEATDIGVLKPGAPGKERGAGADVLRVLNLGFVPMSHSLRDGSRTVSWYRGPLCPAEPEPVAAYTGESPPCAFLPDQNLRYDPEWGMFDTSYSAAWQTGRLLALQNPDTANSLMRWRLEEKMEAAAQRNDSALAAHLPEGVGRSPDAAAAVYAQLLADSAGHIADTSGFRGGRHEKPLALVAARLSGKNAALETLSQEGLLALWKEVNRGAAADAAKGDGE